MFYVKWQGTKKFHIVGTVGGVRLTKNESGESGVVTSLSSKALETKCGRAIPADNVGVNSVAASEVCIVCSVAGGW